MGAIWLHQLPEVIESSGLNVMLWPGWETRSRSSGGYERVLAIGVHHDASPDGTSLEDRCAYAWEQSSDRPIGALWLHTDGTVVVGAAGATNTQGKGGPYNCSKGTIPLDEGNKYMLSIEASNNGVGEVWPVVQQEAYALLCAVLCQELDLDPHIDVVAHFEWTTRKIDPAGNSRYAVGGNPWNMELFREDVSRTLTPEPPTPIPTPEDDVSNILVLEDVRNGAVYKVGLESKSWVRDGHMHGQLMMRVDETNESGVAVDGFRYTHMKNGNVDFIRSTGPIVGPHPNETGLDLDEYGG
jgi:hypothetical protein